MDKQKMLNYNYRTSGSIIGFAKRNAFLFGIMYGIIMIIIMMGICNYVLIKGKQIYFVTPEKKSKQEYINISQLSNFSLLEQSISKYSLDNLIVITICNKGMAMEWLQQWYISARRAGIHNLIVIAADSDSYKWVYKRIGNRVINAADMIPLLQSDRWHTNHVLGSQEKNSSEAYNWRSQGYENVVVQRATILKKILQESKVNVLYSDTDVHWFKNPSDVISAKYASYHICLQREKGDELGDYNCSGIIFLLNSELTVAFLNSWEIYIKKRLLQKGFFTDQEEVNHLFVDLKIRKSGIERDKLIQSNFSACTLDWDEFPSGINFFSHRSKGRGKLERTCSSKMCKATVWKPIKPYMKRNMKAHLVHHNFAKSNQIKKDRAKQFGIWLDLQDDDWSYSKH